MKYAIYLTKSHEVAAVISNAFEVGKNGVYSVAYGGAKGAEEVPPIFQREGTYRCAVTYNDDADVPNYRLVIA